jgi:hypothetical protein
LQGSAQRASMGCVRRAIIACQCIALCLALYIAYEGRAQSIPPPLSPPWCFTNANNLTIVTITAGIDAEYAACMRANRLAYAQRHGHSYCEFDQEVAANRGFGFQKLVALRHALRRSGSRQHQRAWYLDADALITNLSASLDDALRGHDADIVWTSEPEGGKVDALHAMVVGTLGMPKEVLKATGTKWAIQGGSFVVRNTPWALSTMDAIYRTAGSMLVPRPPPSVVPWASLSDRAQWIRWAYLHPEEADEHMAILPGRAFNSMGKDYAPGDLVHHAGGGGAFANRFFVNPFTQDLKYVKLRERCAAIHRPPLPSRGTRRGPPAGLPDR